MKTSETTFRTEGRSFLGALYLLVGVATLCLIVFVESLVRKELGAALTISLFLSAVIYVVLDIWECKGGTALKVGISGIEVTLGGRAQTYPWSSIARIVIGRDDHFASGDISITTIDFDSFTLWFKDIESLFHAIKQFSERELYTQLRCFDESISVNRGEINETIEVKKGLEWGHGQRSIGENVFQSCFVVLDGRTVLWFLDGIATENTLRSGNSSFEVFRRKRKLLNAKTIAAIELFALVAAVSIVRCLGPW